MYRLAVVAAMLLAVVGTAPARPDPRADLEGVCANNTVTPFERPVQLAGRATLSDDGSRC